VRTDERRWILLRTFYRSYRRFHALMAQYEESVRRFAESYGVDRKDLKLAPDELATLLDPQALSEMRDGDLTVLREMSHRLFRTAEVPDRFDTHVASIYHEVSLLKEEHWTVREESMHTDAAEYERYYREVNIYYPKRLRHVRNLYGKARRRLEQLLPTMARNRIIVRSVYLFGEELVAGVYEGGLEEFYGHLYPDGGMLTAYSLAAESFLESGFGAEAAAAYDLALAAADRAMRGAEDDGAIREIEDRRRVLSDRRTEALALA
jgi:hypothetical protein